MIRNAVTSGLKPQLRSLNARPIYQTKGEFALEVLRSMIIDADLRPGQRLRIEDLANQLNMSETPIREALRQLQVEGLVSFQPRGILVAETNSDEVRVVLLMRQALETLAVRLAVPRITAADLRKLTQIHRKVLRAGDRHDVVDFRRFNRDFHATLYRLSGSDQLYEFLRILWARSPADVLLHSADLKEIAIHDHAALLDALAAGDVEEAARITSQHGERTLNVIVQIMNKANSDPVAADDGSAWLQRPHESRRPKIGRSATRESARRKADDQMQAAVETRSRRSARSAHG